MIMIKNIKVLVFLLAIIMAVSVQGQSDGEDEFIKFLENKEIKSYSNAGKALTDYYVKIGLVEAVENDESSVFDCAKVPSYQKEIEKLKIEIEEKKSEADAFVAEDEKRKDYYKRFKNGIDVIINSYDLSMAGYIHDNCE